MKDRYLFKAKRLDNGEWEIGYLCIYPNGETRICNLCNNPPDSDPMWQKSLITHDVDPSTICQCTGLKDKNGKLIWENDILVGHLDDNYPQNATYEMVLWNKSGFCTKEQGSNDILEFCEFDQKYFEVCGNIFDNAELFESEDNMTESEAIKELQENIDLPFGSNVSKEAAKIAMQALEKQIAKKPTPIDYKKYIDVIDNAIVLRGAYWCPNCKRVVKSGSFCSDCGQKLDWSDEE